MQLSVPNTLKQLATNLGLMQYARKSYLKKYYSHLEDEYKQFIKSGDIPLPDTIIWEPTGKCNLRCKFCYINFSVTTKSKEMTFEDFKTMMNKMPFIKKITAIGGELTLRTDIIDILKFCREKNIKITLASNATLIGDKLIDAIAEHKDIASVVVSIDGPEKVHNFIRGWDKAFQRSMQSVKLMREKGIIVTIVSVITKDNLDNLKEIVEAIKETKPNYLELEFERMYTKEIVQQTADILGIENNMENFPLAVGNLDLPDYTMEKLKVSLDNFESNAKKAGMAYGYMPFYFKEKIDKYFKRDYKNEEHFCKHLFVPRIDCSGNVIFCFAIKKSFGNILNQPFGEIWYGKELVEFRKKFISSPILPICNTCEKLVIVEKPQQEIELTA